ncbi:MAG: hypothetical protein HYS26_00420 [Candidatus Kaiserbacteria bacterium]|nr:MAG: hypothetical protein HYS26_00420 [Candidatus Kaiserbacteria bacterium]
MPKKKKGSGKERVIILDSHAILHRAYHAIPDFSTSKGEPTGALYGLTTTLLKAIDTLKPDYIIATRDLHGPTKRHELFEAYKGTRAKTDDELVVQLDRAPKIFEAFGIPEYSAKGYEADDMIGTLVHTLRKKKDMQVVIVSGDMDMLQLVSDNVLVYTMKTGVNDLALFDVDAVKERYGFGPEHVVDYKGLKGDPSDNISGVRGVGEGTASKLIAQYGSLEDIYKKIKAVGHEKVADEAGVQKRFVKLIEEGKKEAELSKSLATIHHDAPIDFSLPKKKWEILDHTDPIIKLCEELEFRSIRERVRALAEEVGQRPVTQKERSAVDPLELRETSIALWLLRSDLSDPTLEDILAYTNADDFDVARKAIFDELAKTGRLQEVWEKIEKPLMPVVDRMNKTGISLDTKYLKTLSREYSKELGEIAARIYQHAGREFNVSSPKQLGTVLYDELKITPEKQKKTAGGARTTREDELQKMSAQHPIIADVLAYRELQKLLSTYIEKMPAYVGSDGRLHAQFLQAGTTTGRMASKDPNLQNIPVKTDYGRRIRKAFAASPGRVLAALDYSQIELRIAAGLSGDPKLVEVFKAGGDIHTAVASEVFGVAPEKVDYEMRRRAKVINFGILYGMGVNALRSNLGESISRDEAAKFLDDYFKKYAKLAQFIESTKAEAARFGYTETLFGRRRYFSGFKSALPNLRAQAERMATNAPMQGTQSDIIKLAMVEADAVIEKKGWRAKADLLLQVHDELVYEVDIQSAQEISEEIRHVMESVVSPKALNGVPIIVDISMGPNWGEVQKTKRA